MYSIKTVERGRRGVPVLVVAAQAGRVMTYTDFGNQVGCHYRAVRAVLAHIMNEITEPRNLPLLTCIVVQKTTGLPGRGFLPDGSGSNLNNKQFHQRFLTERERVFTHSNWQPLFES